MSGKIRKESSYVKGQRHGICKIFFENGQIREETHFVKGQLHGICKEFLYGQIIEETNYVDDKKHGICKKNFDGQIIEETNYVKGQIHGIFLVFFEQRLKVPGHEPHIKARGYLNAPQNNADDEENVKTSSATKSFRRAIMEKINGLCAM